MKQTIKRAIKQMGYGWMWLILLCMTTFFAACTPVPPNGQVPHTTVPDITAPSTTEPEETEVPVALNQRQVLAMQLGLDSAAVEIVEVEPMTWSDSCLGLGSPIESCIMAETPGYRITLAANGAEYVYHTNDEGTQVRLAAAPKPQLENVLIELTLNDESGCNTIQISSDQIAFGRCMSTMMSIPLHYTDRQAELVEFTETFAPFTVDTPTGSVNYNGTGSVEATPAQQRMIAEWAQLVTREVRVGSAGPHGGMILAWHREGGISGFCDELILIRTGAAFPSSCKQQKREPERFRLSAEELATIYTWADTYAAFRYEWRDPAQTDAMTVTLDFFGTGEEVASGAEQGSIVDFAQNLFNEGGMSTAEAPAGCPQPDAGQQLLIQEAEGYCVLYPAAYSLWQQNPGATEIISDTIMNHVAPRASVTVEDAAGRTLEEVVDGLLTNYAPPGFNIEPQAISVAGVAAMLLDEMPGQDLTRRVVLIHKDHLYSFFFAPIGDAGTVTRQQAQLLYQTVIESFRLLEKP